MKQQSMTLVAIAIATVLSGCGGGGGDGSGNGPTTSTTDTTAPVVTLTSATQTIEAGGTVALTATATDSKDGAVQATVTCNGGTLQDGTLTAPAVTQNTDIECTATATDAAGNKGTNTLTIHVTPLAAQLELPEQLEHVVPGQVGVLFATHLLADQQNFAGTLNGSAIDLQRTGDGVLAFVVPVDMQSGTSTLELSIGEQTFSYDIDVGAAAVIADPMTVVHDTFSTALDDIDAVLAGDTSWMSAAELERLNTSRTQIAAVIDDLANQDAAELQATAQYLVANGLAGGVAATGFSGQRKFDADACWAAANEFKFNQIKTIAAGAFAVGGGTVALVTGNLLGAAVAAVAGVYAYKTWDENINTTIDKVLDTCLNEAVLALFDPSAEQFQDGRKFEKALRKPLDVALGFTNDTARTFQIERTLQMDDSVAAAVQAGFDKVADLLSRLPYLPESATELLGRMKMQTTELVPASGFSLSSLSRNDIVGTKSAAGDDLTLKFKAVEPEEENIDFTFSLTRSDGDPINVSAKLMIDLPEAEDASIVVTQGKTMQSSVVVRGADTLEMIDSPSHGSVTLEDDGTFAYAPSGQYFGPDQFTYRARNENGTSKPATVTVDVQRKFEGTWQITAVQHTTSESSEGLCSVEDGTTTSSYTVTKITDTQYSAAVGPGYDLALSMPSADSPGGLSGTLTVQYPDGPDDEGTETETLSVSIPDSSTLTGTTSWSYSYSSGDRHDSCSGTTEITGTR